MLTTMIGSEVGPKVPERFQDLLFLVEKKPTRSTGIAKKIGCEPGLIGGLRTEPTKTEPGDKIFIV